MSGFEGWGILEIMGHRRLAGMITEVEIAGAPMLRIDVPSDPPATQFYSASSIYALTPTSEDTARHIARSMSKVEPVKVWELPAATVGSNVDDDGFDDDGGF